MSTPEKVGDKTQGVPSTSKRRKNMFPCPPIDLRPWCTGSRSWKLQPKLLNLYNILKYFKNDDRYDDGINRSRIGDHPWAIDCHHDLWPWMILNRPRSRSQNIRIKYTWQTFVWIMGVGHALGRYTFHRTYLLFQFVHILNTSWQTLKTSPAEKCFSHEQNIIDTLTSYTNCK